MASLGLLGALGGAAGAAESDWNDQQKRSRDMNDYETRANFAETLQEKMMQRKMQLAQQYPSYTHFVTDSVTGDTRGYTPFGQVQTLSKGDAEQKRLYTATREATEAQRLSAAATAQGNLSLIGPRAGLIAAQTDKATADADKARRAPSSKDKPMSESGFKSEQTRRAQGFDPEAWAKPSTINMIDQDFLNKIAQRRNDALKKASDQMAAEGVHINYGALAAPQEADGDSNDFMSAGDDTEDNPSNF